MHGHYADAGEVAALMSSTLGIDMVMTGHSRPGTAATSWSTFWVSFQFLGQLILQGRLSYTLLSLRP